MSTVTPPVATPNVSPNASPNASAAEQLIVERIEEARSALWWSELTRTTLMVVIGSMLALLVWLVMDHWIYSPGPTVRALCFVSLVVIAVWFFIRRAWPVMTSRVTREYAAWALEQDHPDYRQQLTSYVTLKDESAERGVRARVVRAIGARAASLLKSHDTLPGEATGTFRWWITAAGILAVLAAYCVASPKSSLASAKRLVAPLASIDPARRVQIHDVRPGDAETLAGRDLEVSAEVDGLAADDSVVCRWSTDGPMRQSELTLDPSTDRFVGTLSLDPAASGLVRYTIEAGDAVAGPFHLGVENVPVVAIESVRYQPPEYTKRKIRTTSSPSITAIDGTKIRLTAKVNRPVKRAELQFNPKRVGEVVRPTGGRAPVEISQDGLTLVTDVMLRSARGKSASVELENYRIRVWDSNDQANPDPIIYPIKVIADLPPEVAIVVPKKSPIQVPVGAQQIIEVHAMDADFELKRVTLRIDRGIDTLGNPDIWVKPENGSGKGNHVAEYRFRPLEHRLRVGDVVLVSATAIDNRNIPDDRTGGPNETTSDQIEIRIVDDEEDLPEDPTGNDGLSQPDEQPATDVEKSKQEESGQQNSGSQGSGGQSGGGQGSDSQPSEGENAGGEGSGGEGSGGEGSGGEGSGEQQPDEQQTGEQGESPQNSGGEKSDGKSKGQGGSQQSGDAQSGEQSGSDGDASGADNTSQSSDPQQSDQDPSGDQGAEGDKADGETGGSGQQPSTDQSQGGESMGDTKGSGESTSNGADSKTNAGNTPDAGKQAAGGESGEDAGNKSSGDPAAGQQGTGSQDQPGGEQSKAPPKHDGEAFERIKDYIEKQQQEQNQESSAEKNEPAPKDDSAGSSESGESQTGESQTGESQTGESQTGESQTGESQTGESQTGESQTGESQTGESQTGESQTGESQTGESQTGESQTGESQTGESQTGESQTGESQTGESSGDKDSQSGEASQSDSQTGEAGQDDQATGEKGEGETGEPGQSKKSSEGEQDGSTSGDPSSEENRPKDGSESRSGPDSTQGRNPSSSQDPSQSSSSRGDDSGTEMSPTSQDDGAETPPPPDLDYAKKATDMVLDYLDETRDQVDQDLLKDLDWSRDDLQRFRDRWEKVREVDQPAQQATPANEFEDALRSLGLQQNQSPSESARDSADTLRNLRDSGNRRKAPAAIRDVFEAFRRRQ